MRLSVVVATYNRGVLLERLLKQLSVQTLPASMFEVWVVDDGSAPPVRRRLESMRLPYALHLLEQPNAGPAAARHAGVLAACGEVLVFVDDDMQVGADFLERHLSAHEWAERRVVLGCIQPDPDLGRMPFFERWYAWQLDRRTQALGDGRVAVQGDQLYAGNVSLRRADYLAAGGFDTTLRLVEDAELGLRLEKLGATFLLDEGAVTLHGSDDTSLEQWRCRASRQGQHSLRVARKHPELRHANPWRHLFEFHPLLRPFAGTAVLAPGATGSLVTAVLRLVKLLDGLGLTRPVFAGTAFAYALEFFRGVRAEEGSTPEALLDLARFLVRFEWRELY